MGYEGEVASGPRLEFGPAPATFDTSAFQFGNRDPRALSARGLCYWLTHAQTDLTGPQPVYTHRTIVQVTGSDGLQTAARFETTFNPHHERAVIHAIRVHRAGTVREAGAPGAFEIIQRELNMERAVYDGRVTAHMVIPDVREGDVVETIYSIIGANPALKDRFSWWFVLQWSDPVVDTRCVLRAAAGRKLMVRGRGGAPDPVQSVVDGVRTMEWRMVDRPTYKPERGSPPSWVGYAAAQVADAMNWSDVADVFRQAYEPPATPPADLAREALAIAESARSPEERVVRALRLVQTALRYHSVSVGEGGYRPRALEQIWETRYGDCKDGSVLLVSVLRLLGLDAVCALVNTVTGDDLPNTPPYVTAFDHCIARVRVNGRTLWLDSTHPPQAGDLDHVTQATFHWALPLEPGAKLEAMAPLPKTTVLDTTETWTFARKKGRPADLEMRSTYRSWRADTMRRWIGNEGSANVARQLREGLESELQSPLRELAAVEIQDNPDRNEITFVERYEVEKPFVKSDRGRLMFVSRDDIVGPQLSDIGPDRRREPLQIGIARRASTTRIFKFPVKIDLATWNETRHGPNGLRLDTTFEWTGKTEGRQTLSLELDEPVVPVARTEHYREFLSQARGLNGVSFPVTYNGDRMARAEGSSWGWVWWVVWLLVIAGLISSRLAGA